MKNITFSLGTKEINKAIKKLKEYNRRIESDARLLVQKLTDFGADVARAKIVEMGAYYSGELLSSVDGYYSPLLNAGFVKVDKYYAVFVEFGTGVVGQNSPHTNAEYFAKTAWQYASGSKIFTTKDGKVGWYYPTDNGEFRFTEGMESRPFMYETSILLQKEFLKVATEVFRSNEK